MKYRIEWLEQKMTSTGKNMYKVSVKDEKGEMHTDVAIWEGFPDFANLKSGMDIEGDIQVKQNGQYVNKSLYAPKVATTGFVGRGGGIAKAQETKAQNIEKAQENRSIGVKVSATMRDAVLIVTTMLQNERVIDEGSIKKMIKDWRAWLWSEFDKDDTSYPPFNN